MDQVRQTVENIKENECHRLIIDSGFIMQVLNREGGMVCEEEYIMGMFLDSHNG